MRGNMGSLDIDIVNMPEETWPHRQGQKCTINSTTALSRSDTFGVAPSS